MKIKHYVIALNVLFVIAALTSCSQNLSPADRYAKEHESKSWNHYQDNWMKDEIKKAKETRKERKSNDSKELEKHKNKLARIEGN